jgi:flagellar hook-associated protein 2
MTSSINGLSSSFTSLISSLMAVEQQPLQRLTSHRDSINVQKGIYSDLKGMLGTFQSSVKAMISGGAYYAMQTGYKTQVSGVASGASVLTATAGSQATAGTYNIAAENLALEHRIRSDKQTSVTTALNLSGSFRIGLGGVSAQETKKTVAGMVTAFETSTVASGQSELGTGSYYVETRQDASQGWQFRLVDQSKQAVATNQSADGDWQSIPTGSGDPVKFDTGRGLTITFGADPSKYVAGSFNSGSNPAAQVNYSAAYATINVKTTDSLADIAYHINQTTFPTDKKVSATVVDGQLVLSGGSGGESNVIKFGDDNGGILKQIGMLDDDGAFKNLLQSPKDAVIYVNNLRVQRSKNTNLTDVINGVTLNLSSDANINKSAILEVARDGTNETNTTNAFIKNFNSMVSYLNAKLATTKQSDGTYTRGALAGDNMFLSLRQDLLYQTGRTYVNGGSYHSLSDVGIVMDNNFQLSIKDSTKFNQALQNKKDLSALFDQVMGGIDTKLSRFTGSSGYVQKTADGMNTQLQNTQTQITAMNKRLSAKQDALVQQYAELQSQLYMMSYTQQMLSSIYGSTDSSA